MAACGDFLPVCISSFPLPSPSFRFLLQNRDANSEETDSEICIVKDDGWKGCSEKLRSNHCVHFTCVGGLYIILSIVFVSSSGPFYNMTPEERIDADNRSVYVGNVRLVCLFLHAGYFVTPLI